jgi:hypothetical protein
MAAHAHITTCLYTLLTCNSLQQQNGYYVRVASKICVTLLFLAGVYATHKMMNNSGIRPSPRQDKKYS